MPITQTYEACFNGGCTTDPTADPMHVRGCPNATCAVCKQAHATSELIIDRGGTIQRYQLCFQHAATVEGMMRQVFHHA